MLASPTSLAFKLGADLSGANVVIYSQSYMASSNANPEILPSNDGATLGLHVHPEAAAHQLPMHHLFRLPCPTQWASQSSLHGFQGAGQECIANHAASLPLFVGVPGGP